VNDGKGGFTEATQSGLRRNGAATSLALADLDGDGDLDLYVCQYRTSSIRGEDQPPAISARIVDGRAIVTPADRFIGFPRADGTVELAEKGEPDRLYWNDGKGRFTLASWTQGAFLDEAGQPLKTPPEDWGLSVSLRDLNGDGHPDIYVCNDFFRSRDRVWLGDGRGRFRAAGPEVLRGFPLSSMSIDGADIDRDGHDDFLVAEMLARNQAQPPRPARQRPEARSRPAPVGSHLPDRARPQRPPARPRRRKLRRHRVVLRARGDRLDLETSPSSTSIWTVGRTCSSPPGTPMTCSTWMPRIGSTAPAATAPLRFLDSTRRSPNPTWPSATTTTSPSAIQARPGASTMPVSPKGSPSPISTVTATWTPSSTT
jgi:hypothetical protein